MEAIIMSKFCSSCGSSVPDETTFCPNCGAPVNAPAPAATAPASAPVATAPANPAKLGKNTLMAIGAVAVVIILLIFLFANVLGGGYKKCIKEYYKGAQAQTNCYYSSEIAKYGKNIKYKVKFQDKEKLDKDDIKDLEKGLKSSKGKTVNIKNAYEVECNIKIKGSKDDDDQDMIITVGKIDGKWYILSTKLDK